MIPLNYKCSKDAKTGLGLVRECLVQILSHYLESQVDRQSSYCILYADKSGSISMTVINLPEVSDFNSCILPVGSKYVSGGYNTSASPGKALNHDKSAPCFKALATFILNNSELPFFVFGTPYLIATSKLVVVDIGASSVPPSMANLRVTCTFFNPLHKVICILKSVPTDDTELSLFISSIWRFATTVRSLLIPS